MKFNKLIRGLSMTIVASLSWAAVVPAGTAQARPDLCRANPIWRIERCLERQLRRSNLPNLVALPPSDLAVGTFWWAGDQPVLTFSTVVANRGKYALDLLANPVPRNAADPLPEEWRVLQCVSWVGRACTARQSAGNFIYHYEHDHWHLANFLLYELRRLDHDGGPDMSENGLVATSHKLSFCLADSGPDNTEVFPLFPFYFWCTGVLQGISAGWADVYSAGIADQGISLAGVQDGRYAVMIHINVDEQIFETSYSDNTSFVIVDLSRGKVHLAT